MVLPARNSFTASYVIFSTIATIVILKAIL